jgi:hypothetical protein
MAPSQLELQSIVRNVLTDGFARDNWSRRPCFRPGAAAALAARNYDADAFLGDLCATQSPPFVTARLHDGHREFALHETAQELLEAVAAGGVAAIKLSRFWRDAAGLSGWNWMRTLFECLRDTLCVPYLDPSRSEDTDLFFAGPRSEIGAHIDATHVFTFQLSGSRAWEIEEEVRLDERRLTVDYARARETTLRGPTIRVTLRPGDALYVPAYAAHRVTGVDRSVALSLGLKCFNEIDVVAHLLDRSPLAFSAPVTTAPASRGDAHIAAKIDLARRLRSLLAQLDRDAEAFAKR